MFVLHQWTVRLWPCCVISHFQIGKKSVKRKHVDKHCNFPVCQRVVYLADEEQTPEVLECKRLEKQGVHAAEGGDIISALDFFNQAIQLRPTRPSAYNNRAQALRLKGDTQGSLVFPVLLARYVKLFLKHKRRCSSALSQPTSLQR